MMPLWRAGVASRIAIRSSARRWFSQVTLGMTLSQPSPQSSGRHAAKHSGRLVSSQKRTSGRWRMTSQASSRQASASSTRKSEVMHTRMSSPGRTLNEPSHDRDSG